MMDITIGLHTKMIINCRIIITKVLENSSALLLDCMKKKSWFVITLHNDIGAVQNLHNAGGEVYKCNGGQGRPRKMQ